jgi:hypothetical protein
MKSPFSGLFARKLAKKGVAGYARIVKAQRQAADWENIRHAAIILIPNC